VERFESILYVAVDSGEEKRRKEDAAYAGALFSQDSTQLQVAECVKH
jgi:hypothetical protein